MDKKNPTNPREITGPKKTSDAGPVFDMADTGPNITDDEMRKAFDRLKNIELIINRSPAMTFLWPIEEGWPIELVSDNVEQILGYTAEELVSGATTWPDITYAEDIPRLEAEVEQYLREGKTEWAQEYRLITKSGDVRWVSDQNLVLKDPEGNPKYIQSIVIDITEQKKAENSLWDHEVQYRKTIDAMPDMIHAIDRNMKITLFNKAFQNKNRELGLDDDAIGKNIRDVFPFLSDRLINDYRQVFETGVPRMTQETTTISNKEIITETRKIPVVENGVVIAITTIITDITERSKLEEEQAKASKLESIGILAGGIAHDFNNILTGIIGNISLTKVGLRNNSEQSELLSEAETGCIRARELTRQLLTFSKGGAPVKKTIDIAALLNETATFSLRGSNVTCRSNISSNLWNVDADESQIHQALSNIIINAQQAMPKGGTIELTAENTEITEESPLPLENGRYIMITIADSGSGIPAENMPNIFDPYFTTKQKGSGLGLATSYSIINRHKGHITVNSDLGTGTTFNIHLPASAERMTATKVSTHETVAGGMKILVMDDEVYIRDVISKMLCCLGNDVDTARDGLEALRMYSAAMHDKPYDLVILDLTVPGGMGGKETMEKLTTLDPDVRALISSGYSNDPVIAELKKYGFIGYIPKPYMLDDLKKALQEVG